MSTAQVQFPVASCRVWSKSKRRSRCSFQLSCMGWSLSSLAVPVRSFAHEAEDHEHKEVDEARSPLGNTHAPLAP